MRVLRQKYQIDGKLFDEVHSQLNDLKEGTVVQSVFVVEDVAESEDKSGVKFVSEDELKEEEERIEKEKKDWEAKELDENGNPIEEEEQKKEGKK